MYLVTQRYALRNYKIPGPFFLGLDIFMLLQNLFKNIFLFYIKNEEIK
jgi:hypothetical protein